MRGIFMHPAVDGRREQVPQVIRDSEPVFQETDLLNGFRRRMRVSVNTRIIQFDRKSADRPADGIGDPARADSGYFKHRRQIPPFVPMAGTSVQNFATRVKFP